MTPTPWLARIAGCIWPAAKVRQDVASGRAEALSGQRAHERRLSTASPPPEAGGWPAPHDPIPSSELLQSCPTLGPASCGVRLREAAVRGHQEPARSGRPPKTAFVRSGLQTGEEDLPHK